MVNGVDSWKRTAGAKILIDESNFAPDSIFESCRGLSFVVCFEGTEINNKLCRLLNP
jgi:hypothetical protein